MNSCYWSPNSTFREYQDFLNRLEASIRSDPTEVLLTGDFKAKHTDWGSPKSECRGDALVDLINALGLVICIRGGKRTFNKGAIIDLTIASPNLAQRIHGWRVLDEKTLSDHFNITFEIIPGQPPNGVTYQRVPKIDIKKLERTLKTDKLNKAVNGTDAEQGALALTEGIKEYRGAAQNGRKHRKAVQPINSIDPSRERENVSEPQPALWRRRTQRQRREILCTQ